MWATRRKITDMTRQSTKLTDADWRRLDDLAAATGSTYRGRPSWRALLRRIAQGDLVIRPSRPNRAAPSPR